MTDYTWTGSGDGTTWGDHDNWSTPDADPATSVPGAGDNAEISAPATIDDSGSADDITINASLDLDGGSVTASFSIAAFGALTAESGASITSEYLTIFDTADFDDTTITTSNYFTINGGTVSASNGTQISASSTAASQSDFVLTAGGSMDLDGSGTSLTGEGPGGAVIGYEGSGTLTEVSRLGGFEKAK